MLKESEGRPLSSFGSSFTNGSEYSHTAREAPIRPCELKQDVNRQVQLRQKSAEFMVMGDVNSHIKMRAFVREQKNLSDFELLQLRTIGDEHLKHSIQVTLIAEVDYAPHT